jgi:EAL and modified HD-GYP domain-containing signal transduction protein
MNELATAAERTTSVAHGDTDEIYLARQPILDREERLVAYELLFRGGHIEHAEVTEDLHASSTVVHNTLTGMGIESVLGRARGFVNVDAAFLLSDFVDLLEPERIVLEILESVRPTDEVIARMVELRAHGFQLALDDFVGFVPGVERQLANVDIVKIDLLRIEPVNLPEIVRRLKFRPVKLLAEKVESREQFSRTRDMGFDLFQGYHFARPQLLTARQHPHPDKMRLLRLLALIMGDADVNRLEAEFKRHPMLTYNLLRMVNSAAMGLRRRIDSLRHALVLIGRRSLQSWMQLTLYTSGSRTGGPTPLLQMAAVRGKLMESLMRCDPLAHQADFDAAFLTGILSLLDALLEMPHEAILGELFVDDKVKQALIGRTGRLGQLLSLAELVELDDPIALERALSQLPSVDPAALMRVQLEAFAWANAVETELESHP